MTRATAAAKRSAPAAPQCTAKGRAPKAAKTQAVAAAEAPPSQAPELETEWCRPAFDLLDSLGDDLPPGCADMLRAAMPHALGAGKHARHAYQTAVVDSMTRLSAEALKSHRAAVETSKAAVSALLQEKDRATEQLAAARSDEEAKREAKGIAAGSSKSAGETVAATTHTMEAARKKLEEVKSLVQAVSEAKAEFEKEMGETWAPLKAGAFPPKEWRLRQKAITGASKLLSRTAVPESLAAALPLALKEKLESRTDFVAKVIEHAEIALHEHIASMKVQMERHEATVDSQTQAVAAAEGEVKVAEAEVDATTQAQIDPENAWVDADSLVRDSTAAIVSLGQRGEQLDAELVASKEALDKLQSLAGRFEGLRDNVEEQPMDATTEPAQDVSAAVPNDSSLDIAAQPPVDHSVEAPAAAAEAEGHAEHSAA